MAPSYGLVVEEENPLVGYWGAPTSTLDFCEENYVVSHYVAEFWNTLSNVSMLLLPLFGVVASWREGLELRFTISYILLMLVGVGSFCFHASLLYQMQLLDELPMLFCSVQYLFCLFNMGVAWNRWPLRVYMSIGVLYGLTFIISTMYIANGNPVFHQFAFGVFTILITFFGFNVLRLYVNWKYLGLSIFSVLIYCVAITFWVADNVYCSKWRALRTDWNSSLLMVTQLHGWWHLLVGAGSFLHIVISSQVRMTYLGYDASIKTFLGIPYLHVSGTPKKHLL